MSKKLKGFTIAELLISLLIISLVLSAAIPTLTRKKAGNEQIWQWSESTNSAYFGVAENQSAIIGNTFKPDGGILTNYDEDTNGLLTDDKFVNSGDKLILVKKAEGLESSHISFYNVGSEGTTSSVRYAGRLVLDGANIGLGSATIANSQNPCTESSCAVGNTAIGHYSLVANETGQYNTAIGAKTLVNNKASFNTAVGVYSGFATEDPLASLNTSVGSFSLRNNKTAKENTAVGYMALFNAGNNEEGVDKGHANTAIGTAACSYLKGDKNICIGHDVANAIHSVPGVPFAEKYGITEQADDFLYIGTGGIPLIAGRLQVLDGEDEDKGRSVILNTNDFDVNTVDGANNALKLRVKSGSSGTTAKLDLNTLIGVNSHNAKLSIFTDFEAGDGKRLYINSIVDNSPSADGEFWFNNGKLVLKTSSVSATKHHVELNHPTGESEFFIGNNRIALNSDGSTIIRNSNTGDTSTGFVSIDPNNTVNLGGSLVLLKSNNTNTISLSGTTINLMAVEGGYATLNMQIASNVSANTTFTNTSLVTFNSDPLITGLSSAGATGFTSASTNGVKAGIYALWNAIRALDLKIISYHSDARLKNVTGNSTAGLKEINAIEVKNFTFKNDKEKKPHVGVIAQQLQKVFPNSVIKGDDGYLRVNNDEMFFAMINSIKELFAKIQDLTARVTGLDNRIKKLEQENAQLKKQNAEFEKRLEKLEAKSK